jgi:transposase
MDGLLSWMLLLLALQEARERQSTTTFKEEYAWCGFVRGHDGPGIHSVDLRQARYIGLAKTRLQHLMIASALDLAR